MNNALFQLHVQLFKENIEYKVGREQPLKENVKWNLYPPYFTLDPFCKLAGIKSMSNNVMATVCGTEPPISVKLRLFSKMGM